MASKIICPVCKTGYPDQESYKIHLWSAAHQERKTVANDSIAQPSHYISGRTYEPRKVIRDWGLNFNLGNAVKYISRAGRKDATKTVEDLKKAKQYLEFEIEALEATNGLEKIS